MIDANKEIIKRLRAEKSERERKHKMMHDLEMERFMKQREEEKALEQELVQKEKEEKERKRGERLQALREKELFRQQ